MSHWPHDPDTAPGTLREADLDSAIRRALVTANRCTGDCNQGRAILKPRPMSLTSIFARRARKAAARPFVPQGATQQGRHEPTYPTEAGAASTEIGAEPDEAQRLRNRAPAWPWFEHGCALLIVAVAASVLHVALAALKALQ